MTHNNEDYLFDTLTGKFQTKDNMSYLQIDKVAFRKARARTRKLDPQLQLPVQILVLKTDQTTVKIWWSLEGYYLKFDFGLYLESIFLELDDLPEDYDQKFSSFHAKIMAKLRHNFWGSDYDELLYGYR
ncbi:MAG: hypothetical protein ACYCQJ_15530 [Nitrososphaerales archaeon]